MNKKIIAWFSAGVTSAVACKLAIERYGTENVDIYYIKIKSAHPDNDRFIQDCEKWYKKKIKIVYSRKYADRFEVIEGERYINGPSGAKCSKELKKEVRYEVQRLYDNALQIFGFEYAKKEINRAVRFLQQFPDAFPRFPLIETAINKKNCAYILLDNGIALPVMYELGYSNNNCIGCVKGGKGYWNKIRIDFPWYFSKMARYERYIGRSCINGCFLDQLHPDDGKTLNPILPDCGSLCEIKFGDILDKRTNSIFADPSSIIQLYG